MSEISIIAFLSGFCAGVLGVHLFENKAIVLGHRVLQIAGNDINKAHQWIDKAKQAIGSLL